MEMQRSKATVKIRDGVKMTETERNTEEMNGGLHTSSKGSKHLTQVLHSIHCQGYVLITATSSSVRSKQLVWPREKNKMGVDKEQC